MIRRGRNRRRVPPALPVPDDLEAAALPTLAPEFVLLSWPLRSPTMGADGLSPAEGEVARLAVAGYGNEEIARARGRAVRTVANQLASVYRKLGVGSRVELAAGLLGLARRSGHGSKGGAAR
jgi:DNA-binding CsgD family transcriptional regulator